jgi:hypothetical protein
MEILSKLFVNFYIYFRNPSKLVTEPDILIISENSYNDNDNMIINIYNIFGFDKSKMTPS